MMNIVFVKLPNASHQPGADILLYGGISNSYKEKFKLHSQGSTLHLRS